MKWVSVDEGVDCGSWKLEEEKILKFSKTRRELLPIVPEVLEKERKKLGIKTFTRKKPRKKSCVRRWTYPTASKGKRTSWRRADLRSQRRGPTRERLRHGEAQQRFPRLPGRCPGRKVPVEPVSPGADRELRPAAAEDVRTPTLHDELRRVREPGRKRAAAAAAAAGQSGLSVRRRATCAGQPQPDLPRRQGFPQRGRRGPPRGSLLAEAVPACHGRADPCLRGAGGRTQNVIIKRKS